MRAEALAKKARDILRDLERFAASDAFDPALWRTTFAIAANDLQRDALLPALLARLRQRAPGVVLRVIPSNVPTPEMLREERCHLIVSPRPPEAADIMQKRLFEDSYRVFYDPARRCAPRTRAEYLAGSRKRAAAGSLSQPADVHDLEPPRPRRSGASMESRRNGGGGEARRSEGAAEVGRPTLTVTAPSTQTRRRAVGADRQGVVAMRMMLKVQIDAESGTEALESSEMQQAIGAFSEKFKPEAAYFTVEDGMRTALFFFDMKESSQMPAIAEEFFALGADIDLTPVMTPDDLRTGLGAAGL